MSDPSADQLFLSATPGFRSHFPDLTQFLHQLEQAQQPSTVLTWRPRQSIDYRNSYIRTPAVRLIRWDDRPPSDIFQYGFEPYMSGVANPQQDLAAYVNHRQPSVFVSTTRCYNARGRCHWWTPYRRENRYAYEVYAPFGIDVNASLGPHVFSRQNEIAFPGGITREHIRSVMVYDIVGEPSEVIENPYFDSTVDGNEAASTADFPGDIWPRSRNGQTINRNTWNPNQRFSRESTHMEVDGYNEIMGEDGDDGDMKGMDIDVPEFHQAAANVPGSTSDIYFFSGTQYVRVNAISDTVVSGPANLFKTWKSLADLSFASVDAAVSVPGHDTDLYVFSRELYGRINVNNDTVITSPHNIANTWKSLGGIEFNTVDAAVPWIEPDQIVFFSGPYCAIVNVRDDEVVTEPFSIVSRWRALSMAGFNTISMACLKPGKVEEVYFFCGTQYILIDIEEGQILAGPVDIASSWKSLHAGGFFWGLTGD